MKKSIIISLLLSLFLAIGFSSCSDDEKLLDYVERPADNDTGPGDTDTDPDDGDYDGIVNAKEFAPEVTDLGRIEYSQNKVRLVIEADESVEWTVETQDAWITFDVNSANGNYTLDITLGNNPGYLMRTGTFTVKTNNEEVDENSFEINLLQYGKPDVPTLTYSQPLVTETRSPDGAYENGTYYVFSSNMPVGGSTEKGLMLRTSSDLRDFTFRGYVLSNILEEAKNKFLEVSPATNPDNIIMAGPKIVKVNGLWRLYYTIFENSEGAGLIGYATSPSLDPAQQAWTDRGILITGTAGDEIKVNHPTFIDDDELHYLLYGYGGIDMVSLDPETGDVTTQPERIFTDGVGGECEILKLDDRYYLFVTMLQPWNSASIRIMRSDAINGPYDNLAGDNWAIASIFVSSNYIENTAYLGYRHNGGPSFIQRNGNRFLLHHAQKGLTIPGEDSDNIFYLHVKEVGQLAYNATPTASLELYTGESQTMTKSDIVGTWGYKTMGGWSFDDGGYENFAPQGDYKFNSDGTITGDADGTWEFDASAKQLLFTMNDETVAVMVSKADNSDNLDETGNAARFSAHDYNFSAVNNPGVIMRKTSNVSDK